MGVGNSLVLQLAKELPWACDAELDPFDRDGEFAWSAVCAPNEAALIQKPSKSIRILCYGDSLTAGFFANGTRFSPYGEALQTTLRSRGFRCEVSICGLSGHRADQMVAELDSKVCKDMCGKSGKGLACILDQDGPYDLVILMAGTNDFVPNARLQSIQNVVCKLHDACHSRGVPTVMLAAPCNCQHMQTTFSNMLGSWASRQSEVLAFVDPEDLIPRSEKKLWEADDVHFSALGSRALGQRLAPAIAHVLESLGQQPVAHPRIQQNTQSRSRPTKEEKSSHGPGHSLARPMHVTRGGA